MAQRMAQRPPIPRRDKVINEAYHIARQEGLPPSWFLGMLHAESGFDPEVGSGKRRSSAGAIGFGQLMPGTARGLGVDPLNWRENIRGAARYLKQQLDTFGNIKLALSAYNSGPAGSERLGRIENFSETQRYVKRVAQLEQQYRMLGGGEPIAGIQTEEGAQTQFGIATQGDDLIPTPSYLSSLEKLGPLSAGVAKQAARFTPRATGPRVTGAAQDGGTGALSLPAGSDEWGGAQSFAAQFAQMGFGEGLKSVSEKRDRQNTASGGVSDHWSGNKTAYAFDLSNGGNPTPQMDRAAMKMVRSLGGKWDGSSPLVFNRIVNGYRVQILYRTQVGGNHNDHIHVGVRKVGG